MNLVIAKLHEAQLRKDLPEFRPGDTVRVNVRLKEGEGEKEKERLQAFEGVVISIGDRCTIGRGVSIVGRHGIVIEDDVTTAPNIYITDHNHGYNELGIPIGRQWLSEEPVRIGAGSWLGTGVVVLPGADIGRHVAVASNAVVRGVVPDNSVVAGVPARVVRQYLDSDGWQPPLRREVATPAWWAEG